MKKVLLFILMPFLFILLCATLAFGGLEMSSSNNQTVVDDVPADDLNNYKDYVPKGDSVKGNAIVTSALSKIGCKYVWGAEGPDTFDCSGLVWWACNENGVTFTRTTAEELSKMGIPIEKDKLQPGDIITFYTLSSYVSHVGIYIGEGKMVHAPNVNSTVRVDEIINNPYWQSIWNNARRLY